MLGVHWYWSVAPIVDAVLPVVKFLDSLDSEMRFGTLDIVTALCGTILAQHTLKATTVEAKWRSDVGCFLLLGFQECRS